MTWDWAYVLGILPDLLWGCVVTILVTAACSLLALSGGLLLAITQSVSGRPVRIFIRCAVNFFRGVPILVFLYFGFYALPEFGLLLPAPALGVAVLGLVYAAYCSEVYRGALLTLPAGLKEAGLALALPPYVIWWRILIPLAVRKSVPALVNYILVLYKQSSFLFIIGVPVLLAQAQIAGYQSFRYLEPYTMAGLLYVLLNLPILFLANRFVDATSLGEPRQGGLAAFVRARFVSSKSNP